MLSRNEIIEHLLQYGIAKNTLEKMEITELKSLLKKNSKIRILGYFDAVRQIQTTEAVVKEASGGIESEIKKVHDAISQESIDFVSLYDAIERIFDQYGLNEAIELVLSQSQDKYYKQVAQIVEIAYRAYQETLLAEIERLCALYPLQEKFKQMKFYSSRRGDIAFLRKNIQAMRTQYHQDSFSRIAQQKFSIINDYYPEILYESYEEYYENNQEKDAIIARIMNLTNAYKRTQLRSKKFQVLKHIEQVLLRDREQEQEEKALIRQYAKRIGEAIAQENELMFGETIKEALKVLGEREVQYIIERFDISSNPFILQRFNIIMSDHHI